MRERVILPKVYLSPEEIADTPLFFLAGPCRGGKEWHYSALKEFDKRIDKFLLVNPNEYENGHPIFSFYAFGDEKRFSRQLPWERYFLEQAGEKARRGCIMFWLPCESKTNPRNDGSPYARDSYGELGEWRGRMMHNPNVRVVIGAEKDFPGMSQISRNFSEALGYDFPIYPTLEATIEAAIRKAVH